MPTPTISTADIELRARQRSDMVGSDFISSSELTTYCEKAWQEFYGIITTKEPDLCVTSQAISLAAGDTTASFDANLKVLRGIRHNNSYGLRRAEYGDLERLDFNSRRGKPTHYWMYGVNNAVVKFKPLPTPDTAYSLTAYFIPSVSLAEVLTSGLNIVAGWDEYVVLTAAMKMKDKEESDVSVLMAERTQLLANCIAQIQTFDLNEPPHMNAFSNPFVDPVDMDEVYGR